MEHTPLYIACGRKGELNYFFTGEWEKAVEVDFCSI